ncbi:hypothetical protein [Metamycoplasma hominis]|uniref:hypothetical protein n=1 Tax=Metamycoplasma hominis TaxID=2098 RepID=UPI00193964D7|nr:hypothetical protein [Metamycoplasma hominis]
MLLPFANIANKSKNIAYLISLGLQQMLYSFFITIFFSNTYFLFDKQNLRQILFFYTLIFRIINSSIIIIVLTLINNFVNYFVAFAVYSLLILIGLFVNEKLI